MVQVGLQDGKNGIMVAFGKLLTQYQQTALKVATKEEEAEKAKNQQLLVKTNNYTVDNIINGMAALQLSFGGVVNQLTENLTAESNKLEELKRAIAVEKEQLEQLSQVRLVADALYILGQEHQEQLKSLQEKTNLQTEIINKEITQTRKQWEKEQTEFDVEVREKAELLTKQRELEEADYVYELERQRSIETDDYEEDKRLQERELAELEAEKLKNWQEREKSLAEQKVEFTKNQEKIATFEAKLQEEYDRARVDAIKDADRKAKVQTDLLEKEWEAIEQGNKLKLESLSATITHQAEQIAQLTTQLQEVNTQAQSLAMQAFQTTAN
jgi:DNA repair exonuclease SbcCD ATPase subunit